MGSTTWTVDGEGNVHFALTSNGMSPSKWASHFESHGSSRRQCGVLNYASEAPTSGVIYRVVVLPGSKINFRGSVMKEIRATAKEKGWKRPHWEVSCLIRENFTDEQIAEIGFWWIFTMHEPVRDSDGKGTIFVSSRMSGLSPFMAYGGRPRGAFIGGGSGFAFIEQ